jgi:ferredoxin
VLVAAASGLRTASRCCRHIVYEGLRTQRVRPVTLFHAARSKAERPFEKEIAELADATKGVMRVVRVLSDTDGAEMGIDYDTVGRIDMALLTRHLPFNDYDFYLCGPPQFTQALYDGLRGYNIADDRIHAETFGPSSLKRDSDSAAPVPVPARPPPSTRPVPVVFTNSLKEARWMPDSGSLLELAEARGLEPEFSCRAGTCGTCRTKLIKGKVTYVKEPTAAIDEGEILLCCAVPADQNRGGIQLAV